MLTFNFAQKSSATTSKIAKLSFRLSLFLLLFIGTVYQTLAQNSIVHVPEEYKAETFKGSNQDELLMDGSINNYWNSDSQTAPSQDNPEEIVISLPSPQIVNSLTLTSAPINQRTKDPKKFIFLGTNDPVDMSNPFDDAISWTNLHEVSQLTTFFDSPSQSVEFSINNTEAFKYYQLAITGKSALYIKNVCLAEIQLMGPEEEEEEDDTTPIDSEPSQQLWLKAAATDPFPEKIFYTAGPVETGSSVFITADQDDEGVTGIAFRKSNTAYSGGISVRDLDNGVNSMRFNLYNPISESTPGMKLTRTDEEAWLLINSTLLSENAQAPLHVKGKTIIDGPIDVIGRGKFNTLALGDITTNGWDFSPTAGDSDVPYLLMSNGLFPTGQFKFHTNGDLEIGGDLLFSGDAIAVDFNQQGGDLEVEGDLTVLGDSKLDGKVGIGTTDLHPDAILTIDGHVHISEDGGLNNSQWLAEHNDDYLVWVEKGLVSEDLALASPDEWMDIVFEEDYNLPSLEEVEAHIDLNGYLHTMPSGEEVTEVGYSIHDMNKRVVQTIEELTLHTIEQEKQIDKQNDLIKVLMDRLEALESQSGK